MKTFNAIWYIFLVVTLLAVPQMKNTFPFETRIEIEVLAGIWMLWSRIQAFRDEITKD